MILLSFSNDEVLHGNCLVSYFVEIGEILNNRPVVPVTSDTSDFLALTDKNLLLLRVCHGLGMECVIMGNLLKR